MKKQVRGGKEITRHFSISQRDKGPGTGLERGKGSIPQETVSRKKNSENEGKKRERGAGQQTESTLSSEQRRAGKTTSAPEEGVKFLDCTRLPKKEEGKKEWGMQTADCSRVCLAREWGEIPLITMTKERLSKRSNNKGGGGGGGINTRSVFLTKKEMS